MKVKFRRTLIGAFTAAMMVFTATAGYAQGSEKIIMRENFTGISANEKWNGSEVGTVAAENSEKYYESNSDGYNQLEVPSLTVADAQITAKFRADVWNTQQDTFIGLALRMNGKQGYRMAYYPEEKKLKLEQTDANGAVTDIIDQYGMELAAVKEYTFNFSIKEYMLRADVDGAVILMGSDYKNGNIVSGAAAVVTNKQYVVVSNPAVRGEDKLVYNNFEAGRDFSAVTALNRYGNNNDTNHLTLRTNSNGTISYVNGALKYKKTTVNPNLIGVYPMNDFGMTTANSNAWKNTKLSAKIQNSGGNFFVGTHVTKFDEKGYIQVLPTSTSGATFYKKSYISSNRISTGITHTASYTIPTKEYFDYAIETQTNEDNVTAKYYYNGNLATTLTDTTMDSTFGGFYFYHSTKNETLMIDDLILRDMNANTKDTELLYSDASFKNWQSTGDVTGEMSDAEGSGNVYRVTEEQNGIFLLRDKSWKNVSVAADVNAAIGANSFVAIYVRYYDENNNIRLTYDGSTLSVIEKKYGADTTLSEDSYQAESRFRMEIQAYEGFLRGLINGHLVTYNTIAAIGTAYNAPAALSPRGVGTIGLQAYGCAADFDNVTVAKENNLWSIDSPQTDNSNAKQIVYANPYVNGTTVYDTNVFVPNKSVGNILFRLLGRMTEKSSYFYVQLVENYGSSDPVIRISYNNGSITNTDVSAKLKYGEINKITIKISAEKNAEEQYEEILRVYLNDELIKTYPHLWTVGTGTGQNYFKVLYAGDHNTLGGTATIMNAVGYYEAAEPSKRLLFSKEALSEGRIEAGLTVENTQDDVQTVGSMSLIAALYDESNTLKELKKLDIDNAEQIAAGEARSFVIPELLVPANSEGWTVKAFSWNSLDSLVPVDDITDISMTRPIAVPAE